MAKQTFQEQLRKTVVERIDPKLSRKEVLVDIFKHYTAEMLKQNVLANKNRINSGYLTMLKGYMISEFRAAELGEFQLSAEEYSELFDKTLKEIFEQASANHSGEDNISVSKEQIIEVRKTAGLIQPVTL